MRHFLLFLVFLLAAPATAQTPVEFLYARARGINASMRDSSCDIDLQIEARMGAIPYKPRLLGKYYFKRADKHKLALENAPGYIQKYGSVFGFHLPQLEKYNAKIAGAFDIGGRQVKRIVLVPKVRKSDIERIELYVDPDRGTVPKFDTFYTQGHLYVEIDFVQEQNYWVYSKMTADFSFPSINAKASASYANYQFNQNLSDSLFTSAAAGVLARDR